MSPYALSVDYGTSNTVAVLRRPDGQTRPLLFDGSPLLPSAVYASPEGHLSTGRDAVNSARLDPARFEPNPKRHIDEHDLLLGGAAVPLTAVVAATLSRVAHEARHVAGAPVAELVMTHPAEWGAARRQVLLDAARASGLPVPRLVPEPVAAGTYFTAVLGHRVPADAAVVVYDLGGGTFDASVVRRTANGFETLAYRGLDDVGGVDIDDLVVQLVGTVVGPSAPAEWSRLVAPQTLADRRAARQLRDDARMLKERLSRESSAALLVPIVDRDVHVTRAELEARARTPIAQTVAVTAATIKAARITRERLAGVFLVGGSTRMPQVATELHRATQIAPTVLDQPELVVAEGALLLDTLTEAPPAPAPIPTSPAPVSPGPIPVSAVAVSAAHGAFPVSGGPVAPVSAVPVSPVAAPAESSWPAAVDEGRPPVEFASTPGSVRSRAALWLLAIPVLFAAGTAVGVMVYKETRQNDAGPYLALAPFWLYALYILLRSTARMITAGRQPMRLLLSHAGITITVRGRPQTLPWTSLSGVEVRRLGLNRRPILVAVPRPGVVFAEDLFWRGRLLADGAVRVADLGILKASRAAVKTTAAHYLAVRVG